MHHVFKYWPQQYLVNERSSGSFSFVYLYLSSLPTLSCLPLVLINCLIVSVDAEKKWRTRAEDTQTAQDISKMNGVHS